MRGTIGAAIASTWLVCAVVACTRPAPRTHTVRIQNFAFTPAELVVSRGDTVVWTNTDFVPHSATARDNSWGSRPIASNASWRFVARDAGRRDYYCVYHPNMKAALVVR